MEEKTKQFARKIKFDTYIYTITFTVVSLLYFLIFDLVTGPVMLLLAAFAFYTLGRQVSLLNDLEAGQTVNTKPRAPIWVRFVTYLVVMLLIISTIFAWVSRI